jgi:ankyrin repeat protein
VWRIGRGLTWTLSRAPRRSQDGDTPLHHAVERGKVECVKVLVQAGANKEAKGSVSPHPTPLARPSPSGAGPRGGVAHRARADLDSEPRVSSLAERQYAPAYRGRLRQRGVREGAGGGGRQRRGHGQGEPNPTPLARPSPPGQGPRAGVARGLNCGRAPRCTQNGKTPLDLARERGHSLVVKLLTQASRAAPPSRAPS